MRTVVLLAEHSEEGSFGLILNRPGHVKVAEFWKSISGESHACQSVAFSGGPVQPERIFILHKREDLSNGTDVVIPGVFLGGDDKLFGKLLGSGEDVREGSTDTAEDFRIYCGYAGWGKGQLDDELKSGGWIRQPSDVEMVFADPPEDLWARTMAREAGPYKFFGMMPPNPELN